MTDERDDVPVPPKRGRDGRRMNPRSLANLRPNPDNLEPGAGASKPGEARALKHGARTTTPQRSPAYSPAVMQAAADLAARVGDELRDEHGELLPWAVPSIEAVATLRVALARVERWTADREERGEYTPEDDERLAKVASSYHKALEKEALTLRSRLEARGSAMDLARAWAEGPA